MFILQNIDNTNATCVILYLNKIWLMYRINYTIWNCMKENQKYKLNSSYYESIWEYIRIKERNKEYREYE